MGKNVILEKLATAVVVAYFLGRFAANPASPSTWLALLAAAGLFVALAGCGNLPSLNPEPTLGHGTAATAAAARAADGSRVPAVSAAPTLPSAQSQPGPGVSSSVNNVSVDRIAYIGPYGDLFTISPDGGQQRRLTGISRVRSAPAEPGEGSDPSARPGDAAFHTVQDLDFSETHAWPTWSPDGSQLAVSRVQLTPNRSLDVSVQVIDAATGVNRVVYQNDVPALVADGAPHYLYWSPDGEYLSFLATTRQGLTLFAVNPGSNEGAVVLERGAPLYFSWDGGGQSLIIHSREEVKLLDRPLSPERSVLVANSAGFRTPALAPDGGSWALASGDPADSFISLSNRSAPATPTRLLDTGSLVAFMWSPDGRSLAVADNPDPRGRIFQRIRIVSADGAQVRTLAEEPLIAFYWAPTGERLAWVGVDAEDQVFHWKVAPVPPDPPAATGSGNEGAGNEGAGVDAREIFRFRPSGEVFTMLSFFDQYAYSHSPWSPDGTRLVVAGSEGPVAERRNGHTPTGSRIYVLDAIGDTPPAEIAQGNVAFWSWN